MSDIDASRPWEPDQIAETLTRLRTAARLIGHLAASDRDIEPDEWRDIEARLLHGIEELRLSWEAAARQGADARHDAAAALAVAEARKAAPGSAADVAEARRLWDSLRTTAAAVIEAADVAQPPDSDTGTSDQ
jgi:hypothetical protein